MIIKINPSEMVNPLTSLKNSPIIINALENDFWTLQLIKNNESINQQTLVTGFKSLKRGDLRQC